MAARGTFTQAQFLPVRTSRGTMRQAWLALTEMARTRQTRRQLAEMDDRMLADIGINRGEALTEASRASWDLIDRRR